MSDKRTPHTDALDTLGSIITPAEQRDAIHLAVENGVAGHRLKAGDHIGFLPDGTFGKCNDPVGIVDPFLKTPVKTGEHFWVVVYPREITSLRHVWSHPSFPEETKGVKPTEHKSPSQQWIDDYADELGVDYESLMRHAGIYLTSGEYWNMGGLFEGVWLTELFWDHYQVITGTHVKEDDRNSFFTCSC